MNARLEQDLTQLNDLLAAAQQFSADLLSRVDELPASIAMPEQAEALLPQDGAGAIATLNRFREQYGPYLAAGAGPRYWGFVTGGVTPAALAGDWLASAIDMNAADKGGAAFNIEIEALQLARQLFGLPDTFAGSFVSGATMSNFTGLAVARQWLGRQQGKDIGQQGLGVLHDVRVLSCVPHSSVPKCLSMLGIGRDALVKIPALPLRESVNIAALESWLETHKDQPVIYVASAGTVNTTDFDDIAALAALKERYNFWLHIDAAFGGFAACSPKYAHLLKGWEAADSITIDAHKWMNVPYDAAMIFCRYPDLQAETFKNVGAAYLGDPAKDFNFIHHVPENSRRLRALPAWYSLLAYGRQGYKEMVEDNIRQAKLLGSLIDDSPHFMLLSPVNLCVACFTLNLQQEELAAATARFLEVMATRGIAFMTPTVYKDMPAIRAAIVNWRTTEDDVRKTWQEMEDVVISNRFLVADS
ncbi:pyridoxal-dependent decarboxylase [uncultured Chitinophaga sp.]|jgi:Glutamate decarboxylase and related PLP-dependent proteins|uniref:pyridoxal phosphate-dependent decarboxylase family protein n=1 Tax=uncultured Chitinophaga sp. TaxID=339340 RepID=UPI002625333A|nr:pyridoxal-dependent decarboxylase [uncultured Chitinophaga sp.]